MGNEENPSLAQRAYLWPRSPASACCVMAGRPGPPLGFCVISKTKRLDSGFMFPLGIWKGFNFF